MVWARKLCRKKSTVQTVKCNVSSIQFWYSNPGRWTPYQFFLPADYLRPQHWKLWQATTIPQCPVSSFFRALPWSELLHQPEGLILAQKKFSWTRLRRCVKWLVSYHQAFVVFGPAAEMRTTSTIIITIIIEDALMVVAGTDGKVELSLYWCWLVIRLVLVMCGGFLTCVIKTAEVR